MASLIGISVAVTLQSPPDTVVQGTVAAVNAQTATLTLRDGRIVCTKCSRDSTANWCSVFFPGTQHHLASYNVEGHAIADIKVNSSAPRSDPPPYSPYPPSQAQQHAPHPFNQHVSQSMRRPAPQPPAQPQPFVDPAILSMGKRTAAAPVLNQPLADPPQEAPATPIHTLTASTTAPVSTHPAQFAGGLNERHNIRKPSAATLEGPFSSLDIADADEADSETRTAQPGVRRTSITKTRNGKPMDDLSPQKIDDGAKKTRRGGKSRKKEVAAQERKNGADMHSSPDAVRKEYVLFPHGHTLLDAQANTE